MIDCIAGYHLNPWTCGIAKFNAILAKHLDVEVVGIRAVELGSYDRPLLSLKLSEFTDRDAADLDLWSSAHRGRFELFLHAFDHTEVERRLVASAARVYVGNTELFGQLLPQRPDVQELFCPGTILNPQRFMKTDISVFTFGMAHKIRVPLYRRLHELLEATGQTYSVYVSTALHENTSFDGSFVVTLRGAAVDFRRPGLLHGLPVGHSGVQSPARQLVSGRVLRQGPAREQHHVNAAMECGCTVITNLDELFAGGVDAHGNVVDINQCDRLPTARRASGSAGRPGRWRWGSTAGTSWSAQLRAVAPAK